MGKKNKLKSGAISTISVFTVFLRIDATLE